VVVLPTASAHRQAAQDLARLQENRDLLVQRLERVMAALALTLDAEAAAEERIGRLQAVASTRRMHRRPPGESALLAQRYRDVIHAIEAINADVVVNREGARP
jgi:hypothetical protein